MSIVDNITLQYNITTEKYKFTNRSKEITIFKTGLWNGKRPIVIKGYLSEVFFLF
jgi:hypothetical protein